MNADDDIRWLHHREQVMGTVVTFDIAHAPGNEARIFLSIARARKVLQRADAVFSTWRELSPINRLRRGEITVGEAPPEVAEVLEACRVAKDVSLGWFDPWAMPGGVDPTGYVKGWAAERALAALVEGGATRAIVNAAGDIATYGSSVSSAPYRIGIVDPHDPQHLACVVEIDGAIATSGTYERGEHLLDPHTATPCSRIGSASVVGPDLGLADALATALAVAGEQGLAIVDAVSGYEALTIGWDGAWKSTRAFPFSRGTGPHAVRSRQTA